jgi:hypothetical protein
MPSRLHHNIRDLSSISATSAAANYPATNLRETSVDRPWRSTTNALQNIDIDLANSLAVTAIGVQMTNAPTVTVFADTFTVPTTSRGVITPVTDNNGRRKGSLAFSATVRYIRLQIPATSVVADDDGTVQAYYTIGSVYVFANTLTLPRDPLYGQSSTELLTPQTSVDLANGQNVTSNNGAPVTVINLGFSARAQDDVERARRLARLGPAWLDLDIASERWRQWPVRSVVERVTRSIARVNGERVELPFRELA